MSQVYPLFVFPYISGFKNILYFLFCKFILYIFYLLSLIFFYYYSSCCCFTVSSFSCLCWCSVLTWTNVNSCQLLRCLYLTTSVKIYRMHNLHSEFFVSDLIVYSVIWDFTFKLSQVVDYCSDSPKFFQTTRTLRFSCQLNILCMHNILCFHTRFLLFTWSKQEQRTKQ